MSRRSRLFQPLIFVCVLSAPLLMDTQLVRACMPSFERAVFTHVPRPDLPLERFAGGRLGILEPTYARSYLVVAYRVLNGRPLDAGEVTETTELWRGRLNWVTSDSKPTIDPVDTWLERRRRVVQDAPIIAINVHHRLGPYDVYEDCLKGAFRAASGTLDRLTATFGVSSPTARAWVLAQDAVFMACSGTWPAPAPLPAGSPPAAVADRAYQIAAALFYAQDFDGAATRFRQIAADPSSPWRTIAPYLVARTLIRKGTLTAGEGQVNRAALTEAQAQLRSVMDDPAQGAYHRAAADLIRFVRFRLDPVERAKELANALVSPAQGDPWASMLDDYTLLLNKFSDVRVDRFKDIPEAASSSPLGDWVMTMQATDQAAFEHAWSRWQSSHAVAWLVAAISKSSGADPRSARLREAAATLTRDSPAFLTASFHSARLAIGAGDLSRAQADLDRLIAIPDMPGSARNQLLALRLRVAATFDEWLGFAMRTPVTSTDDIDASEMPEFDPASARLLKLKDARMFDTDVTQSFNMALPLSYWGKASASPVLNDRLRRDVAVAGWTRAVLTGNDAVALQLAPVASRLSPALSNDLAAYVRSAPATRRLAAITTMLRFPGMTPVLAPGLERESAIGRIDAYRDNWWCTDPDQSGGPVASNGASPRFVDDAGRAAAQAERTRLDALGDGPRYLASQAIALARQFPDDPRAPEILSLAVRATRYGCGLTSMGDVSKRAFDVLHSRYPKSEWARKTPYWYGDR